MSLMDYYNQVKAGKITTSAFWKMMVDTEVWYSTPFGDHVSGKPRVYLIGTREGDAFLPVFTTKEGLEKYFEEVGRVNYLIMHSSVNQVKDTMMKDAHLNKLGILIDKQIPLALNPPNNR